MKDKIKVGIIGTGGISNFHIKSYLNNDKVELYAFCDINEKQLSLMSEQYGVKHSFLDCNEMLSSLPELDAVSVCTWNSAHAPCVIAALNAGKHVLCEKPMSYTLQEAFEMKEAADKNNKLLMIGFVRRFGKDTKMVMDFIRNDELGEVYYAKATYLRRHGNPGGWFGEKAISGGGPMIDLGIHVTDLSRYLMGNPKPVSVYGAAFQKLFNRPDVIETTSMPSIYLSDSDICDVEDMVSAMVRYDNGAVVHIESSFSLNIKEDYSAVELMGDKGGVKISDDVEFYSVKNGYLTDMVFNGRAKVDFDGIFQSEINHFVDCVADGIPCLSTAADGVEMMKIIDGIYRSAESRHEVII